MELTTGVLVAIIISSVAAFVLLVVLLYFLFLRNKNLVRISNELIGRYESTHRLLIGADYLCIKRLEEIAQVNLLYGDIHNNFLRRYQKLLDRQDRETEAKVMELQELIDSKRFKSARDIIGETKSLVNELADAVNKLDSDLQEISQPEESGRQQKTMSLEAFNKAVTTYESQHEELAILKGSYTVVIQKIEKLFQEYDDLIEEANYDEANLLLPRINKIIVELNKINEVMPKLCYLATKVIPQKIGDLKVAYKRMLNDGCPVVHLISDKTISRFEDDLAKIVKSLKGFVYKHKEQELNDISSKIDFLMESFEKERKAREEFEAKYENIRSDISYVEKDFIKLCNSLPRIKQYYLIAEEKLQAVTAIQNLINKLGVAKRSFDNLLHNGLKTPYSVLLERSNELNTECEEIKKALADFRQYLTSLKDDVEYAHQLVSEYFYKLKKAEKIVHDASLAIFHEKYDKKIDEIYRALDTISVTSTTLPIDVSKITEEVNFVKFDGDSVLNQISQDQEMMQLAEGALTYANRGRHQYKEINAMHKECEKLFEMGEFEKAYLMTKDKTIKRLMELNAEK